MDKGMLAIGAIGIFAITLSIIIEVIKEWKKKRDEFIIKKIQEEEEQEREWEQMGSLKW